VVLAASWREGEDAPLLAAWQAMLARRSAQGDARRAPLLLLVPRHPQRFDEVAHLVADEGLTLVRRSSWGSGGPGALAREAQVWLGDSMGEMPAYYACADVALLGGSFAPLGGQNLIEAAACGCPVVMGAHTFNFTQAAERAEAAGAACRCADLEEAVAAACVLAESPAERAVASTAAQTYAGQDQGAARRMAEAMLPFISSTAAR